MSYNSTGTFTAGICVNEVKKLMDLQGDIHNPLMKRSPLGFVEFLNSPLNNAGRDAMPIQISDKKKQVLIQYLNRAIDTQVDDTIVKDCSTGDFDDYNEVVFDVDKQAQIKWSANEEEVAKICSGQGEFFATIMAAKFDAITKKINKALLTEMLTNFGANLGNGGATTAKSLTVYPAATGNPNATPLQELDADYTLFNQFAGSKAIVGGGNIWKYMRTLQAACCNDGGVDMLALTNQLGASMFTDVQADSVLGANHFMVLEPTTTQFVTYNEYVGERTQMASPFVENTTITDPRTGITYDLKVRFDECNDIWTWDLRLNYGLFIQPLDAYQVDDELQGTNGTLRYVAATS